MRKFNEKKVVKCLMIVVMCSIILGGVGYVLEYKLGIIKSNNDITQGSSTSNDKFNIEATKEFSKGNIKTINVETVSTDVNIITSKEDKIRVHFYGNSNSKKSAPHLEAFVNGDDLDVLIKYPGKIFGININTKINLDIYVPEDYKKDLKINTTSGDVIIGDLRLDKFKFQTTSGDAKINLLTTNETIFEGTSGKVNVKSLLSKKNEFKTTSGDTKIENITGDILGQSVSGWFKFKYKDFNNDINIDSTSGDVELKLPKKSEFKLDFDSTSGDLRNDFPITVTGEADKHEIKGDVGNGNKIIKINTTSGNATINASDE
ncbi:DUF4097 domain-containing protein [Clostridium sp. CM027]|uniref:DUF4097 family beta strand repeat-containing protein n=1 Tax=Clostridium sp. CM027 TaxID=2849865 RepID=UPI001C6E1954|nr:DUF4097 family beta strand repeat-containing protein [Clostridium sp. CM027]MBW9147158.1 DUF4097 domain-containing protein [Clostridium sp. CM027]UVE41759.1 DUF4097 domain-containing protein [Clostridium sp. CM027]